MKTIVGIQVPKELRRSSGRQSQSVVTLKDKGATSESEDPMCWLYMDL